MSYTTQLSSKLKELRAELVIQIEFTEKVQRENLERLERLNIMKDEAAETAAPVSGMSYTHICELVADVTQRTTQQFPTDKAHLGAHLKAIDAEIKLREIYVATGTRLS